MLLSCIVIYESSERNDCTVCDMRAGRRNDMRADIARAADTGRLARVRQADGTTLSLRICGDEFFHYAVTSDGYSVDQGPDGFYYYLGRVLRPVPCAAMSACLSARRRTADERRLLETLRPGVVATALRARAHRLTWRGARRTENGIPYRRAELRSGW